MVYPIELRVDDKANIGTKVVTVKATKTITLNKEGSTCVPKGIFFFQSSLYLL